MRKAFSMGLVMVFSVILSISVCAESVTDEASGTSTERTVQLTTQSASTFTEIKNGDQGDNVVEIQRVLIEEGYLEGEADGLFGNGTEAAVSAYQSANGLEPTGIVDEDTYKTLLSNRDSNSEAASAEKKYGKPLDSVKIIESNCDLEIADAGYTEIDEFLYISVIVHNNSTDKAFNSPEVQVNAKDEGDALLGSGIVYLSTVFPGMDTVFAGMICDVSDHPAIVEFNIVPPQEYNTHTVAPDDKGPIIVAEGVNKETGPFQKTIFTGEAYNTTTDYDVDSASVYILFRNEQGSLIGGDLTYADGLSGGSKVPFEISVLDEYLTDDYAVYAVPMGDVIY